MLRDQKVVITRPQPQGKSLAQKLNALGIRPILFPTMEIAPLPDNQKLIRQITALNQWDLLIFISRSAVHYSGKWINQYWPLLPQWTKVAAIGKGTADALADIGITVDYLPAPPYSSESLLALPRFRQTSGEKIAIVRGQGGRELLATTLEKRGAKVDYIESYARLCPKVTTEWLLAQEPNWIITTSGEGLGNLYAMTPTTLRSQLLRCRLIVVGHRMAQLAQSLGFIRPPHVAEGADDNALLGALVTAR
jgi:uroporphyrinogen-III synthase